MHMFIVGYSRAMIFASGRDKIDVIMYKNSSPIYGFKHGYWFIQSSYKARFETTFGPMDQKWSYYYACFYKKQHQR